MVSNNRRRAGIIAGTGTLVLGGIGLGQITDTDLFGHLASVLSEFGLAGFLLLVVFIGGGAFLYAIATSKIYTARTHDEIIAMHEETKATQKETIKTQAATISTQNAQIHELITAASITSDLFKRADLILKEDDRGNAAPRQ